MPPALVASLHVVAATMRGASDPWWIIAGAAVALHGVDAGPVSDVDVLISSADARRIFSTLGIAVLPGAPHPDFQSRIFGTWTDSPLPVEFMADFRYRHGVDWCDANPVSRQPVAVDGVVVFVPERGELVRLLEAFGRPKDIARARRLSALG